MRYIASFRTKIYITLSFSFILLMSSLYLITNNVDQTNKLIQNIEVVHLKFLNISTKLNHNLEKNQTKLLQSIILDDINNFNQSFKNFYLLINNLDNFVQINHITSPDITNSISNINNILAEYKSIHNNLRKALKEDKKSKLKSSLIDFNTITVRFSKNIDNLIDIANIRLANKISNLRQSNKNSKQNIIYLFVIAFILILSSIYRLTQIQQKAQKELQRAEKAESMQKQLQVQLLKYNEDLENEISKKTQELHTKIYTHFISGLANRNQLLEDSYKFEFKQMALLNIDNFQKFNDVYGEELGNIALKLSADFLSQHFDDDGVLLYHVGGDEFVFAVKIDSNIKNNQFIKNIEKILSAFKNETFIYEDKSFNFIMSAGIAFNGKKKMLAYADMALKDAKNKNIQLSVFNEDKELEQNHKNDMECHKKLLHALDNGNIISHFQPIAPIQDASLDMKYESLVRMRLDDGSLLPPIQFLNVAKQNRIYDKITKSIVKNTLHVILKYKISCSLNISMEDIENTKTLSMLYKTFNDFKYNNLLTIELLETEDFKNYDKVYEFCTKIRSYGIKIALDDFGAGYSNFSHILNLPIDFIKIDASLISNIDRDKHSQIMVKTIVRLAHELKIQTIAEFVSSKEILDTIKTLNVDYAQGYYIGKPEEIKQHLPYLLN